MVWSVFGNDEAPKDEALAAAVLKGIQEAKVEMLEEKSNLQKAYNVASGLLKGLSSLRDLPGSEFKFRSYSSGDALSVETDFVQKSNGDRPGFPYRDNITVTVESNGRMTVSERDFAGQHEAQILSSKRSDTTEKALSYIAKKATLKGLIP